MNGPPAKDNATSQHSMIRGPEVPLRASKRRNLSRISRYFLTKNGDSRMGDEVLSTLVVSSA